MAGEREALRELQRQINEGPSPEAVARVNEALADVRRQMDAALADFNFRMQRAVEQARNIKWPPLTPAPVSRQTETTEG